MICIEDCYQDGNFGDYDLEIQRTRNQLEAIVNNQPALTDENRDFLRELLNDGDVGESVGEAICYILEG